MIDFIKRTAVRRVVWIVVGLLVYAVLGLFTGEARASVHTNQAQALQHCNQVGAAKVADNSYAYRDGTAYTCTYVAATANPAYYQCRVTSVVKPGGAMDWNNSLTCDPGVWNVGTGSGANDRHTFSTMCPEGTTVNGATGTCDQPCDTQPGTLTGGWTSDVGAKASNSVCNNQCGYVPSSGAITVTKRIDGVEWLSVDGWLKSSEIACPAGAGGNQLGTPPADGDGDGTSDGADAGDNNAGIGSGSGEDGSVPPGKQAGEAGSGDGNGNTSGGGGDCKTPPHSTGNAITANILYQTWATRCAIENSKGSDGLLKVKVEGSGTGTGGTSGGGTDMGPTNSILSGIKGGIDALKDFFTGDPGTGPTTGEDVTADGLFVENEFGENGLDQSGFGYGGACPAPITVQVMTQSITFDAGGVVCDWVTVGGWFVMLLTAAACLRAIGRA